MGSTPCLIGGQEDLYQHVPNNEGAQNADAPGYEWVDRLAPPPLDSAADSQDNRVNALLKAQMNWAVASRGEIAEDEQKTCKEQPSIDGPNDNYERKYPDVGDVDHGVLLRASVMDGSWTK
jgi:hypothetical protein